MVITLLLFAAFAFVFATALYRYKTSRDSKEAANIFLLYFLSFCFLVTALLWKFSETDTNPPTESVTGSIPSRRYDTFVFDTPQVMTATDTNGTKVMIRVFGGEVVK